MNGVSVSHQRGAVTLIGALFLIFSIIVLLGAVQRMAASSITDSALHNDGIEALFIAESGLERAAWRFAGGSACTALAGETGSIGRGSFLVQSAGLVGVECRVQVSGSVTTTIAVNTVTRTLEGDLVASGSGVWAVGNIDGGETIINWDGSSWSRDGPYGGIPDENLNSVYCVAGNDCWGVGDASGGDLIIHWDGSSWSRSGPYGSVPNANLQSVYCVTASDCWAVGIRSGYENINHWNGSTWSRLGNTPGIPNKDLHAVYMVSATEGYVVGEGGTIASWDGSNWSGQSSPTGSDLNAVFAGSGAGGGVALVHWSEVIQ
jgi:hypothetical protein